MAYPEAAWERTMRVQEVYGAGLQLQECLELRVKDTISSGARL